MARSQTAQRAGPPVELAEERIPVTYRDTRFRVRTLVLPSGGVLPVQGGEVATAEPDEIAWLDRHADFERLAE